MLLFRPFALLSLAAVCIFTSACQKLDKRVTKANFDQIKPRMTLAEVEALLGPGQSNPEDLDIAEGSSAAGAAGVTTMDLSSSSGPKVTWYKWGTSKVYIAVAINKQNKVPESNFKQEKGLK
ncbi:MAG: hypothetical protein ACJ8C4_07530 [Gemmataceae bacterium]